MCADGDQIRVQPRRANLYLSKCLYTVTVRNDVWIFLLDGSEQLRSRLNGPELIVDEHDGDELRIIVHRIHNRLDVHSPAPVNRCEKDGMPHVAKRTNRLLHARMLDGGRDNAPLFSAVLHHAEKGHVVALRPAGGKKDLLTAAAEHPRQNSARFLQKLIRLKAHHVQGGRVPILAGEDLIHLIGRLFAHACGCAVVQISGHPRTPYLKKLYSCLLYNI